MSAQPRQDDHVSIHVLVLTQYGDFGGPHGRIGCIAPLLADAGATVTVLMPEGRGDAACRLRSAGVEVITRPFSRLKRTFDPTVFLRFGSRFLNDIRTVRQVLRMHAIDLVQVHGLLFPQGALAARLEGVPLVWQLNDKPLPIMIRRAFMRVVTHCADVVMTTGTSIANAHPGATSIGNRLVVFFPAVDAMRFLPDSAKRAAIRKELGFSESELVVGTIANINPYKDLRTFVRAATLLRSDFTATRFVILGKTHNHLKRYAESLWREATALGLRFGIDLIQRDGGARVAELAQSFDVFWLTSVTEGTPNSLLEAMALELPVIATDVGGVGEIVQDGITGFVVPPRDPDAFVRVTRSLLRNHTLRQGIGSRARRSVKEQFTPEICASAHLKAYKKAIDYHRFRVRGRYSILGL